MSWSEESSGTPIRWSGHRCCCKKVVGPYKDTVKIEEVKKWRQYVDVLDVLIVGAVATLCI